MIRQVSRTITIAVALIALVACAAPSPGIASPSAVSATATPTPTASSPRIPAHTYEVGGRRLYMDCQGAGSTTVIFLHSLGGRASDWNWTLSLLADASACKYDRLGVGRSEEAEERHTATDSAEELRELLEVAGISPPFVLVGHSFGGELALLYAGIHPEQVAGIVLVDAMLPFEAALDAPEVRDDVRADMNVNGELLYLYEAYAETDAVLHELPDVPITYMASTISPTGCACGSSAPRDVPPEWEAGAYTASLEAFMAGLPQGRLVRFESTHDMPSDIPDDIAAEVQLILEQVSS